MLNVACPLCLVGVAICPAQWLHPNRHAPVSFAPSLPTCPALQIVNIVSNDVRRFDDAMPFYNFLICSPGELRGAAGARLLMGGSWRAQVREQAAPVASSAVCCPTHSAPLPACLPATHPPACLPASTRPPPAVELIIVFVLVGTKLGFWASLAGCATQMALIPTQVRIWMQAGERLACAAAASWLGQALEQLRAAAAGLLTAVHPPPLHPALPTSRRRSSAAMQAMLVRYIGRLRASTAAQTDERVRLTGEVISGVLATKMLGEQQGRHRVPLRIISSAAACVVALVHHGCHQSRAHASCGLALHSKLHRNRASSPFPPAGWEGPFLQQVGAIRQREAHFIRQGARIRAFNMGLSFAITPLVRGCCCCWRLPCGWKPMLASGRSSPPFHACS